MERLWAGAPIGAHPRRRFASFAAVGKGGRPAGRNPARCGAPSRRALRASRPTGTGGPVSRPYGMERKSPNEPAGGASPSPTGRRGNIPRREIGGRPHRAAPTTSQAKNSKAGGRAGLLTRPPVLGWVSFHAEDFAPQGEFLSQRWERNQRIAGGRLTSPSGTSSLRLQFVFPRTPVYGGYPYTIM